MKDDHIRQESDTFNVSDSLRNEYIMFTPEDFEILKQPGSWEKGNIVWIVEAVNALNRPELQRYYDKQKSSN